MKCDRQGSYLKSVAAADGQFLVRIVCDGDVLAYVPTASKLLMGCSCKHQLWMRSF